MVDNVLRTAVWFANVHLAIQRRQVHEAALRSLLTPGALARYRLLPPPGREPVPARPIVRQLHVHEADATRPLVATARVGFSTPTVADLAFTLTQQPTGALRVTDVDVPEIHEAPPGPPTRLQRAIEEKRLARAARDHLVRQLHQSRDSSARGLSSADEQHLLRRITAWTTITAELTREVRDLQPRSPDRTAAPGRVPERHHQPAGQCDPPTALGL